MVPNTKYRLSERKGWKKNRGGERGTVLRRQGYGERGG